jgi:flavin-dependent dehydrogenase
VRDVVVLGGGPAGCAAALELARSGLSVVVVDRPRGRRRAGDLLPPDAIPWLDRLGLCEALAALPRVEAPGIVSWWETDTPAETDFLLHPFGPGWHLDRESFDTMMAGAARRAGAALLSGSVQGCRSGATGWEVAVRTAEGPTVLRGRWLIDGTGRAAWLVRRLGVRLVALDHLVAVLAYLEPPGRPDPRLFVEAAPDGWWYAAPLPGGAVVAAFLTDHDLLPRGRAALGSFWDRQRGRTRLIRAVVPSRPAGLPLEVVAAGSVWAGAGAGPGWLAVGDAALAHDPLAGHGLLHALASGCRAADAVRAGAADAYQAEAGSTFAAYKAERDRLYSSVPFWADRPFWQRRRVAVAAS